MVCGPSTAHHLELQVVESNCLQWDGYAFKVRKIQYASPKTGPWIARCDP